MNSNKESNPRRKRHWCWRLLKIPFVIAAILLATGVFFWLWNALIPDLFHGPEITYLQALGLLVLSKLIFGSGFRKCGGHHHHGHRFGRNPWAKLSPEEREKIIEAHHHHHHGSDNHY